MHGELAGVLGAGVEAPAPAGVELIGGDEPAHWARALDQFEAAGGAVPLAARLAWLNDDRADRHRLVAVGTEDGGCRALAAFSLTPMRALPGHRQLTVERFQGGRDPDAEAAVLRAVLRAAHATPRLLRARVRLFHPDPERRRPWAAQLAAGGFRAVAVPREYRHTLRVDLAPGEDALFAGLHATARRHIRAVAKHEVEIRVIDDAVWAARMRALAAETYARTGGDFDGADLPRALAYARAYPEHARVLGLFRRGVDGADSLLAFAVGLRHGDHVEYATAASTRAPDLKLPLSYGLAWGLIQWARAGGARWFDFGGVTAGRHADGADPLGGISDFKRYFTQDVVDVAEEWEFEPSPWRARLARWLRTLAGRRRLGQAPAP